MQSGDSWLKLKKAEKLLEEAEKDLEVGCFNKAVSASYFAVRLAAEAMLKGVITTKDDKIANAVGRVLGSDVREEIMWIYEERKKADHRPFFFDEKRASLVFGKASEVFEKIKEEISSSEE